MTRRFFIFWVVSLALAACGGPTTQMARSMVEPKARPTRNFTSFDAPLRCMDKLLSKRSGRTVTLSSTGIPDQTGRIRVAADDMLINALNRMTRTSRAYVFLDQELVKANGLIDLLVAHGEEPPRPSFYIRGAISQLDTNAGTRSVSIGFDHDVDETGESPLGNVSARSELEVVSVDLHLVAYPSRRVVAGASVSNSLVVREHGWGAGVYGLISMTGVDAAVQIDRIESTGQAVRNLIEVSLIELIGRHAGVPYWQCLASPDTNARQTARTAAAFARLTPAEQILEGEEALVRLGRLDTVGDGRFRQETRAAIAKFQAEKHLLVTGHVDFNTMQHLRKAVRAVESGAARRGKTKQTTSKKPSSTPRPETKAQAKTETPATSPINATTGDTWRILLPPNEQRTRRAERTEGGFVPLDELLAHPKD